MEDAPGLPLRESPIVAREAELGRLLSALDSAAAGQGRMVAIAGEPGVGKTRLAHELLVQAAPRGFRGIVGRCFEQYATVPFLPWSAVLSDGLGLASPALRGDAIERWPEPSPEGGQLRLFQTLTAWLRGLAIEHPLVVVLEDAQWADSASLGLLLYLGRHLHDARIVVLTTYRDADVAQQHPLDETLRELVRERLVDEIVLRELNQTGSAALMRARLGVARVSDEFAQVMHARTAGNPFFIEEVLKALVEQGGWEHKAIADIDLPRSVRSVVGQRVGRLSPEVQELLRMASVLGHEFAHDVLVLISGQPEAAVLDHLDAAFRARLVVERGRASSEERYAFAHALIQETLYAELPAHRLRRLHLRVGEVLEELRGTRPDAAAELARHFELAGDAPRALEYLGRAGDFAAQRFAHFEAAQHYASAVQLAVDAGDDVLGARLREKLALELSDASRVSEALVALDEALDTYRRVGDAAGQARVHYLRSRVHHVHFDYRAAVAPLDDAVRLWPADQQETADFAALLLDAARVKSFTGDHLGARPVAERGLALCERLCDAGLLARALCEFELTLHHRGAPLAEQYALFERAEGLARAAGHWRTLGRVHMNRGSHRQFAGDLLGSRQDREQAVAAWERGGIAFGAAWGGFVLAQVHMALGDWRAARGALRKTREYEPSFPGWTS